MSCKIGGDKPFCKLNDKNGYITNCSNSIHRAIPKMGVQHQESYEIKTVDKKSEAFSFRPSSPTLKIFPNKEKSHKRPLKRNWSVNRTFFRVKSGIEKVCLQDQIEKEEKLRKIPNVKHQNKEIILTGDLLEWKLDIQSHEILWKKQVIKHLFCPMYESFFERDELVIEPADTSFNYEEEDCF